MNSQFANFIHIGMYKLPFWFRVAVMASFAAAELLMIRSATWGKFTFWKAHRDDFIGLVAGFAPFVRDFALLVLFIVSFGFFLLWREPSSKALLTAHTPKLSALALNLLFFGCVLITLSVLPAPLDVVVANLSQIQEVCFVLAPLFTVALILTFPFLLMPVGPALGILWSQRYSLSVALVTGVLAVSVVGVWSDRTGFVQDVAGFLLSPTLFLIQGFFEFCGMSGFQAIVNSASGDPVFGNDSFSVAIAPHCTGFEGAALTIAILSVYLFIQRNHLRMPLSLLILPIAALIMFIANAVRIAVLILIGVHWSPEIAVGGFHTVAGWINLIITVVVAVWVLERSAFFSKVQVVQHPSSLAAIPNRFLLLPIAVWIGTGLLTTLFTGEFRWLYPVQVIATAVVIAGFWASLAQEHWRAKPVGPSLLSLGVGVAVALMWLVIIPADPAANAKFEQALFAASALWVVVWTLFRIVGTAILVPFAEELAFRGFLQTWLADWLKNPWLALGVSSLAFGLVHANVLAGVLAGLAYGLVKMHRGNLWDAIAAHAVTNLLIALYVVVTGQWAYW